jgi:hypothetical protein
MLATIRGWNCDARIYVSLGLTAQHSRLQCCDALTYCFKFRFRLRGVFLMWPGLLLEPGVRGVQAGVTVLVEEW